MARVSCCIDVDVHFRASALHTYLDTRIGHPEQVHWMWLVCRIKHFRSLCSHRSGFLSACRQFVNMLSQADPLHWTLQYLADAQYYNVDRCNADRTNATSSHLETMWAPFPFHPAWRRGWHYIKMLCRVLSRASSLDNVRINFTWCLNELHVRMVRMVRV